MKFDLAIINTILVTSKGRRPAHIYIKDEQVAQVSLDKHDAKEVVDASGLIAIPGAVDSHVHFMDPAETDREDFITGSSAAAVGGVTTVVEHTHAGPVCTPEHLVEKVSYLKNRSVIDFGLAAHVWPDRIEQLPDLWQAGAMYFKAFTCTTHGVPGLTNADLIRVFELTSQFDGLTLVHCEDETLTDLAARELQAAKIQGGEAIPMWRSREAESLAVNNVVHAALLTGARISIAHASNPAIVRLANSRRAEGARVYVESCPQYLFLREEEVLSFGSLRKFTPPARARSTWELNEMWNVVNSGLVSYISSDHAPSTTCHKSRGIWDSPFGLPGVETTVPMLLKAVADGLLSLEKMVELISETPSRILGLYPKKGTIAVGSDADIVLIDLSARKELQNDAIVSKAGWTPYAGAQLQGLPVMTFSRGKLVAKEGKVVGQPGHGLFIPGPGKRASWRA